jgi:general secretion pathway protein E
MAEIAPARLVPFGFAKAHHVLAHDLHEDELEIWVDPKTPPTAIAELVRMLPYRLKPVLKSEKELQAAMTRAYSQHDAGAASVVDSVESDIDLSRLMQDVPEVEDLLETEDDAPIIRMINALLTQAARDGASDIHIEPFETHSLVRYRVDGTLRDVVQPKRELHSALISRIKIMAQLDIAEKRLPQDGRITLRIGGRPMDVRVSTLPTGHGERAVLRLLDKEAGRLDLAKLGMSAALLGQFDELARQPHGILLVTGPTGSGKTTTLYSSLARLDAATTNILTVEDPIEYDLSGIGQTQVNPRIDMTFARALRSILRQDPDVIMIGEIRDIETAQIAVQASLTGHLVLATLHTNDSVSAITRLVDMGVEPFLLSSSLLGVVAQRLVRKLCTQCKTHDSVTNTWRAVGCSSCNRSGFAGRTGIYELLTVTDDIRALIHQNASEQTMRESAKRDGMVNLREDGQRWISTGATSLDEVVRVTRN